MFKYTLIRILIFLAIMSFLGCGEDAPKPMTCQETVFATDAEVIPVIDLRNGDNFAETPLFGERFRCLKIPRRGHISHFKVLYSVAIVGLMEGDIIQFVANSEFTNDTGIVIFAASQTILAADPNDVTGIEVTPRAGYNITPDIHHGEIGDAGFYQADRDFDHYVFLNFVVYAGSNLDIPLFLHAEPGYGGLDVLITPAKW